MNLPTTPFRTFQSLQASTQSCEAWAHRWHPSVVRPFGWFQDTMTLPPPNQQFSLLRHTFPWKEAKGTGLFMASFWGNGFSVKHNVFLKWFAKVSDERRETRNELKLDKMEPSLTMGVNPAYLSNLILKTYWGVTYQSQNNSIPAYPNARLMHSAFAFIFLQQHHGFAAPFDPSSADPR